MGAWGSRSNQLEVTMTTSLQKGQPKRSNVLGKIKVQGEVDAVQKVIVRCETAALKWKGLESQMVIWRKMYRT
jgi:microcompartment protein CcmL/EutN